jgi:hypothetical protein
MPAVSFIDNQQFDQMRKTARDQKLFFPLVVLVGGLDQVRERCKQGQHLFFDASGASETGGV